MNEAHPTVSVIIASFNLCATIGAAVRSVRSQDLDERVEVITERAP